MLSKVGMVVMVGKVWETGLVAGQSQDRFIGSLASRILL